MYQLGSNPGVVRRGGQVKVQSLRSLALLGVLGVAACGGGGSGSMGNGGAPQPPARGTLLQSAPTLLSTVTASNLLTELNAASNLTLLGISGPPVCDVLMYNIKYETV